MTSVLVAYSSKYGSTKEIAEHVALILRREGLTVDVKDVVRHAKASHASVVITILEDAVQLIVEDNGVGFDSSSVAAFEHVGLSSMRERVELVGGSFTVESLSEKGTTVSARLPTT
jgi:signal transduction histidine kinase